MTIMQRSPLHALLACGLIFASVHSDAQASVRCANGATVDNQSRCQSFAYFRPRDQDATDIRIVKAIGGTPGPVRSIGVLVGVSDYPNFPQGALEQAKVDLKRLTNFLVDNQRFDEVIVLENSEATPEAIHYFLSQYAVTEGRTYRKRARVLFAFTGHGVVDGPTTSLALSDATSASNPTGLYSLRALQADLQTVAGATWQVLGLVDACYGGDIFTVGFNGGNADVYWKGGAYVVTAGSKGSLTWAMSSGGSVFFDAFLNGIENRTANELIVSEPDPKNKSKIIDHGRVITQAQAVSEATRTIRDIETGVIPSSIDPSQLSEPWVGSIEPNGASEGAFFFLANPPKLAISTGDTADPAPLRLPVNGKITGIDVSHNNGKIDWKAAKAAGISFAYVKATQGALFVDSTLTTNLNELHAAGLAHGVYATYDFCADPVTQATNLSMAVPAGADILPTALDIELSSVGPRAAEQQKCATSDPQVTRANLLKLLELISKLYGKQPIIYSPPQTEALLDSRFNAYQRWVPQYKAGDAPSVKNWTIWQSTGSARLKGVPGMVDLNVFNGTGEDFMRFRAGAITTIANGPSRGGIR